MKETKERKREVLKIFKDREKEREKERKTEREEERKRVRKKEGNF